MTTKYFRVPLAAIAALSISPLTLAHGVDRYDQEIWHSHPEKLESTRESGELPYDFDDHDDIQNQMGMTVDVELLAKESGMSKAQAEAAIRAQDQFARYADRLISKFPERIGRMWIEPAPGTRSHIQFVGKVPDAVLEDMQKNRVPDHVSITGGATITFGEHEKRTQAAARALRKSGFVDSSSAYNPARNVIELNIRIPDHARNPDPQQILSAIQNELRGTDLRDHIRSIRDKDLHIKTQRGKGPIMSFDHGRGGNWLRDDGFRECTSGWSVSGPNGDGIITAAHCTGLNQFEEEGGLIFDMTWRDQEFGSGGDVEYHTTNHIELDDFYARQGEIRDVSGIRSTWTMWGGTVCEYGRSSNTRTCNHTVDGLFVTVNYSIGTVNNLVRVTGDNSIGGDSGGGWSFNYTAWGVHSGSNGSQSFFTPAQLAESSLNVTIKR